MLVRGGPTHPNFCQKRIAILLTFREMFYSGILILIYSSRLHNRETVRYWISVEKQNGEQQGVQH